MLGLPFHTLINGICCIFHPLMLKWCLLQCMVKVSKKTSTMNSNCFLLSSLSHYRLYVMSIALSRMNLADFKIIDIYSFKCTISSWVISSRFSFRTIVVGQHICKCDRQVYCCAFFADGLIILSQTHFLECHFKKV